MVPALNGRVGGGVPGGHPAKIRAYEPRKQKNDRRDAQLLLRLLEDDRFPTIWMPSVEQRDVRALLRHRHQWVRMRVRIQNALQALALSHAIRRGSSLWSEDGQYSLLELKLPPFAQKGMGKAAVAAGRKLGVRLWIMLRDEIDYDEFCRRRRQCGEAQAERPDR